MIRAPIFCLICVVTVSLALSVDEASAKHKKWIETFSFSQGATTLYSSDRSKGDKAGKIPVGEISVNHPLSQICRHCPRLIREP
jgi:hypothetical protein